jgi:hypothetical protein
MLPKGPGVKGPIGLLRSGGNFKRWGLVGGLNVIGGMS